MGIFYFTKNMIIFIYMKKYKILILLAFILFLFGTKQVFASTVWEENFNDPAIDQKGATGSGGGVGAVIDMAGITKWSINTLAGDANLSASTDWFRVDGGVFEARDVDADSIWETESIDITGFNGVSFELDAIESGDLEGTGGGVNQDYLDVFYSLDGGAFTQIPNWNTLGDATHTLTGDLPNDDDWVSTTISQNIPSGHTSLKIRVTIMNSAGTEYIQIDNVKVLKNDIPILSDLGSILNFTEGDADTILDSTITIVDDNDTDIEEASITISGNYQSGEDSLVYVDTATIIGVWDAATGTLDLLGTDTKANYEVALESIKYSNSTSPITTSNRTITWKVNDGDVDSIGVTSTINITAANSIPTDIQIDGSNTDNVNEGTNTGTSISTLTTTDSDAGDTHTYTLVAGIGDEDNAKFQITGTNLQLNFTPDFENPTDIGDTAGNNTYSIRIQTDDGNGGTYQESFIITINDVDENIPVISLLGSTSVTIYKGETYTDAGATAHDDTDGDITANIVIVNPVDTNIVGTYTITYNVDDSASNSALEVTRTVIVKEKKKKGGSKRVSKKRLAEIFGKKEEIKKQEKLEDSESEEEKEITEENPLGGELCSADQLIHNLMKNGDTNGVYSSYNKGIITEVSLLQSHINRILQEDYGTEAAGPVDIWFRSQTERGVKRLQRKLNSLNETLNLTIDGIVGPYTREAINHSC